MSLRLNLLYIVALLCGVARAGLPITVTRCDWNAAITRFNAEYAAHPPTSAQHDLVQQKVDAAYSEFFAGNPTAALQTFADALALLPTTRPADDAAYEALQVQILPVISRQDRPGMLRIRIQPIYPPPGALSDATLSIHAGNAKPIFSQSLHLDFSGGPILLNLAKPDAPPGEYESDLIDPAGRAHRVGSWFVVAKSLDAQRINTARLLTTTRPTTQQAWDAQVNVRARNTLLTDSVDLNNPTILTGHPSALAESIAAETAAVMKGQDPFVARAGDDWRGIACGANILPARVYAPTHALGHPAPLLICLPETTEDENDLFDRLPGGPLQTFAEKNGWIVLSTRTLSMLGSADALTSILRTLGEDYLIDRQRVCLLGHGTGATAAVDVAVTNPDSIDRLVLIGGGEFGGVTKMPPARQIVGTLDEHFPPQRASVALDYAKEHGLPLEQSRRDDGHRLLLNDALDDALRFLLKPAQPDR